MEKRLRGRCLRAAFAAFPLMLLGTLFLQDGNLHAADFRDDPPTGDAPPGWARAYDYLIQDVCIDERGSTIENVSPADSAQRCPDHRKIRIGERLPYHKQDWASADEQQRLPLGLQRSDSFPIGTQTYGTLIVQARGRGRIDPASGRFVAAASGGGIYFFSDKYVASGFTEDVEHGPQFFLGPRCASHNEPERHLDAWIFVSKDFSETTPQDTVALQAGKPKACALGRFAHSYTLWRIEPLTFRVRMVDGIRPRPFKVLVSDHFGGPTIPTARNLERFYFTREFGLTRWERWQNLDLQQRANDLSRAQALAGSGRCDKVEQTPPGAGRWVMVDCRQWTNISPADDAAGDPPTAWIDKLKQIPEVAPLLK